MKVTEFIEMHNCRNEDFFETLEDESVDVILTDPPYKYLKNQKLEVDFDEELFFNNVKRVLKPNGFIILFGRGTSFYRWNTMLADLGFNFKEEIIWDKRYSTSPVLPLARKHETISIFSKDNGVINSVRVPVTEMYKYDPEKIERIIIRLETAFGNRKSFKELKAYYKDGTKVLHKSNISKFQATRSAKSEANLNRTLGFAVSLEEGAKEQSIMKEVRPHYNTIHPTQKPVRIMERLLALVIPKDVNERKDVLVFDPFMGSAPVAIACHNMHLKFKGCELDEEYFQSALEKVKEECSSSTLFPV